MKKTLLSVGLLFSFYFSNAQNLKLKNEFAEQRLENEKKLDSYFSKSISRYSQTEKDSLKNRLAGFTGQLPVFYSVEETGASATSNVDELQGGTVPGVSAVTGNGVKITIFDEGRAHDTHEQFTTGRVVNKEVSTLAKSSHTTNMNGIILGNGTATGTFTQSSVVYPKANAKGVLPQATTDNYLFTATALGNNFEKLSTLADLNISNHSYGANNGWNKPGTANTYYWYGNYDFSHLDTYSGTYGTNDQSFDKIVYAQPQQIIVKSTGNYYGIGPNATSVKYRYDTVAGAWVQFAAGDELPPANCSLGYNCIGYGSLAKNIITVGAVNQLTTTGQKYTQSTDVVKYTSGSAGPRKDGAVKPDLVAVGVDMIVPNFLSTSSANNLYLVSFGTSYSAAVVSGIAGALTQVERNLQGNSSFIFKADEMKALLTHTANEAGRPGPDVWYGWGIVDAKKAAQVLVKKLTEDAVFQKNTLSGVSFTKEIKAAGTEPLKVSISWVDPAIAPFTSDADMQNNHASRIVNDLDLRVVEVGTGAIYYPWKLDINDPNANATKGDNTVDNVEQIVIDNPIAEGIYRIEISSKNPTVNQDGNPTSQDFALVATGTKKIVTMAVDDLKKEEVKIYPTRTRDIINIELQSEVERIAVFDTNGKLVLETNNKAKSQAINLNKFPSSVYIITIKTKAGIISKKIIKE